jgi:hypothetical protein
MLVYNLGTGIVLVGRDYLVALLKNDEENGSLSIELVVLELWFDVCEHLLCLGCSV